MFLLIFLAIAFMLYMLRKHLLFCVDILCEIRLASCFVFIYIHGE